MRTAYDTYYDSFKLDQHLRTLMIHHYQSSAKALEDYPLDGHDENSINEYERITKELKELTR